MATNQFFAGEDLKDGYEHWSWLKRVKQQTSIATRWTLA
jgi:hypothetical protein